MWTVFYIFVIKNIESTTQSYAFFHYCLWPGSRKEARPPPSSAVCDNQEGDVPCTAHEGLLQDGSQKGGVPCSGQEGPSELSCRHYSVGCTSGVL